MSNQKVEPNEIAKPVINTPNRKCMSHLVDARRSDQCAERRGHLSLTSRVEKHPYADRDHT